MFADTTYSSEADENGGGKILGVSGVEVAIEQSLYDQLTADAKDSKTSGVLGSLFAGFTPNGRSDRCSGSIQTAIRRWHPVRNHYRRTGS